LLFRSHVLSPQPFQVVGVKSSSGLCTIVCNFPAVNSKPEISTDSPGYLSNTCSPARTTYGRKHCTAPRPLTRSRLASTCSKSARSGKVSRRPSGQPSWRRPGGSRSRDRTKIAELFADKPGDPRLSCDNGRRIEGRQAHRWQKTKQRPARPRNGRAGDGRRISQL